MINYDAALIDADRLEEIELMVMLMVAATESPGRVPTRVIDQLLGVAHDGGRAARARRRTC